MRTTLLLLSAVLVSGAAYANPADPVHEYKLDNGLRLLVKVDNRAPVVISQVWYRVGSSYEPSGLTGISHVLEHMMFKGTPNHPPNEFSRIVAANGGQENAFTSRDYTGYYQQLEKSRLPVSFELEADRMRHLNLDPAEFAKEVQVVIEERRMRTDDDPQSLTSEQFNAVAHINSPYRNPVIGWRDDLDNLRAEDLRAWYQQWYAPNNATVVVAGDVEPEEVLQLAKKYFGPLQPSVIPKTKPQREVEQKGERRITVRAPAELPVLLMGYHAPGVAQAKEAWEPYALEVLANVLDGGDSARFATNVVRGQEIAASLNTGYDMYTRHDSVFSFSATPTQAHTVADVEAAVKAEIKKIQDTPPSAAELQRVKAQVVAGKVYERDSLFYQATQLGELDAIGLDYKLMDEYVARISAITPEQVQAVAKKYFTDDRLTAAVLDPLPIDDNAPRPSAPPTTMIR